MPKDFQQTDTVAPLGADVACSGVSIANTAEARLAVEVGSDGILTPLVRFTLPQSADEAGVMWELDPLEDVPTGDHIIRLTITTTNTAVTWTECHVCYWDDSASSFVDLGNVTGLGIVLDTAQLETATITGADAPPAYAANDRLYYVAVFDATGAHGNQAFNWTPVDFITTPIVVAGGNSPYYYNKLLGYQAA